MSRMPVDFGNNPMPGITPAITQAIAVGASSVASTAFNPATTLVELIATANCWIVFGAAPVAVKATTTQASGQSSYLPAGVPRFYGVTPGQKVAAIEDSGAGVLTVNEAL